MEFLDYLKNSDIDYKEEDGKIVVKGDLDLRDTKITKLPNDLSVGGWLNLSYTPITKLPNDLSVHGNLYLNHSYIKKLPNDLKVYGGLSLCSTSITELPDNLSVGGSLNLSGSKITKLPKKLSVGFDLDSSYTPITELPDNFTVNGNLNLINTKITELPDDLSVKSLYVNAGKITNIAYHKDCTWWGRPIFAAYVNGEIQISADCFLGNIEKFESAVDDKYSGTRAGKYKQAARECISELEQMRNRKN